MDFLVLLWLAPAVYLILHYLYFHSRLALFKDEDKEFDGGVSVIICARNEERNLAHNLPFILQQDYPQFEVVVVNDRSTDGTEKLLRKLAEQHPQLKLVTNHGEQDYIGKKKALTLGINSAEHEHLLLTDADCIPVGPNWIRSMVGQFPEKGIILGFGGIKKESSFINKIVRWETLQTLMEFGSFALAKMPYMGVGRNLAYKRRLFKNSSGFESHIGLPSGDDDLFVSENGEYNNVVLRLNQDSFTFSKGPESLARWWRQKRRHVSTSSFYRFWPKVLLTMNGLAQLFFYVGLPAFIYFIDEMPWLYYVLMVKLLLQFITLAPNAYRMKCPEVLVLFPLWDFISVFLLTLVQLQNLLLGKPKAWK